MRMLGFTSNVDNPYLDDGSINYDYIGPDPYELNFGEVPPWLDDGGIGGGDAGATWDAIKHLFSGGGSSRTYLQRLTAVAVAIAKARNMPVGAYMENNFLAFYPNGSVEHVSAQADANTAGYILQTWVNKQATTCVLITKIEPTVTKDVTPTAFVEPPKGVTIKTPTSTASSNTWIYIAVGAVLLWAINKAQ
jgi:hypothetical protein